MLLQMRFVIAFLWCCAAWLPASELVDELVAEIAGGYPPESLTAGELGDLASELDALLAEAAGQMPDADVAALRLVTGRAWLGGGDLERANELLEAAWLALAEDRQAAWVDARLAWVVAARAAGFEVDPAAARQVVARWPDADLDANARAQAVDAAAALRAGDGRAAVALLDEVLGWLGEADPRQRLPYLAQRVATMEQAGADADQVAAWLQARGNDPAVGMLADIALVPSSSGLLGRPAPALVGPTADGGRFDLTEHGGRPAVVAFFATWSRDSQQLQAVLGALLREQPAPVVVAVSMDFAATAAAIEGWAASVGNGLVVVSEGLGWDGELDDAWAVGQLPHLVVVNAEGQVVATDLIGDDAATTLARVRTALQRAEAPAAP